MLVRRQLERVLIPIPLGLAHCQAPDTPKRPQPKPNKDNEHGLNVGEISAMGILNRSFRFSKNNSHNLMMI